MWQVLFKKSLCQSSLWSSIIDLFMSEEYYCGVKFCHIMKKFALKKSGAFQSSNHMHAYILSSCLSLMDPKQCDVPRDSHGDLQPTSLQFLS